MIKVRKILAIKVRSLGDTVLVTAPLAELRRAYPDAAIHVVAEEKWAPILEAHPAIDKLWPYSRPRNWVGRITRSAYLAGFFFKLWRQKFDCVVNFHASTSTALFSRATGARVRAVHFHGHKDENRYSTVIIPDKGRIKPIIERDMDVVRALGINVPEGKTPEVHVTPGEIQEAREQLAARAMRQPLLALGIGASRPTKSWPTGCFARLAIGWVRRTGGAALALGGADDDAAGRAFLRSVNDELVASGGTGDAIENVRQSIGVETGFTLRELAGFLSICSVYAGNDSGCKHVAAAVGAPTCTVFGPEHPYEWHPYSKDRHPFFFVEGLMCRKSGEPGMPKWCGAERCVSGNHGCMNSIKVEDVLGECVRIGRKK
ncbi:MAG: hypothetical protein A2583_01450 [Bdellovibrionales bacterium RIFOXYD1_FULL_53_11]|nr:MAG: hypothetical protein A2583_01450 [Bdellovibrionales bacterium RIFOXYD1_FULL_53_11]